MSVLYYSLRKYDVIFFTSWLIAIHIFDCPDSRVSRPFNSVPKSPHTRGLTLPLSCLKNRKKSRFQGGIGFDSARLKNWYETFKPIAKSSNSNRVICFNSHSKTALSIMGDKIVVVFCPVFQPLFINYLEKLLS